MEILNLRKGLVGTTDGFCQLSFEKSLTWARAYGGERNEYISSVLITSDGGVAIVGYSSSFLSLFLTYLLFSFLIPFLISFSGLSPFPSLKPP